MTAGALPSMLIEPLAIAGAFRIRPVQHKDDRGFFARTFCAESFAANGLATVFPQHSTSFNARRGTLRGLHYQVDPYAEIKTVRCTRGKVFDVLVDLRKDSPSFGRWHGEELDPDRSTILYIPEGCAHGFQTLADDSEIYYEIATPYVASASRGVRYNDPDIAIRWPLGVTVMSDRDAGLPLLRDL